MYFILQIYLCLHFMLISDGLRSYFEKYGEIRDVDIKIDPATQASRGFGFILFADPSSVDKMEADMGQHHLGE